MKYCKCIWSAATYMPRIITAKVIICMASEKPFGDFLIHPNILKTSIHSTDNCCKRHMGHGFHPRIVIVKTTVHKVKIQTTVLIGKI
ncbi:hypothetical protein fh0823_18630 [Francisella halioticida]|nr:hypothetical protein fh0823_18630 [Francisella halioticida]